MKTPALLVISLGLVRAQYYGSFIGPLTDNVASVGGAVFAVDQTSVLVTNFTHDGSDPGTFIYAGTLNPDGSYTKTGYPLTNVQGIVEPVAPRAGQLLLQFPEGKSLYDVDWIGVLSRRKKKMIGRVLVSASAKLNVPGPVVLGPMVGRGALSGDVVALDSHTLMIKHLVFGGNQPDTYFMVGSGPGPGPFGVKIPDEDGSLAPLGSYRNRTIILSLPSELSLRAVSWLALWSHPLQSSFAEISIPRGLNIPPSTRTIGVTPQHQVLGASLPGPEPARPDLAISGDQSKLNCEVLSREVGLQVRWSVVADSAILQVVANLGSEMYMAFGVKEGGGGAGSAAAGDVVVGWINSGTGRGGLDDYFLSGTATCSDGAESCPDSSRPGGTNNVEMLNSVSRDNYTMITFKRPLLAEDIYDTTIRTDGPQEVFWSVGYKKAEMRMKHKPLRNTDPIFIDFGRLPAWNCPVDEDTESNEIPEGPSVTSHHNTNDPDDLESEPSYNLRRKFKGKRRKVVKKPPVKILDDFLSPDYRDYDGDYSSNYNDYNNNYSNDYDYSPNNQNTVSSQKQEQNAFTPKEIAMMKKKFEEKLKKDFPKRKDGQKTTLELIPELGTFVEPFFPKGPPPGAMPPGGPGGGPPPLPAAATHPPPAMDENWAVPSVGCNTTDNTVFYLQIGPAAVNRGNQGLGQFGQAWYVNGDVAPDLYLVRGHQYTFIVEGGLGTDQEGIIHPFYLTSDNEGGYGTKSDYEARMEEIYGGLAQDREGRPVPAIMGRLCEWRSSRAPATFATYADFKAGLEVRCQETGEPGVLRFSPDFDMPGVMYYQSFSEKLLGGKIHLLDQCHETLKSSAGSDYKSPGHLYSDRNNHGASSPGIRNNYNHPSYSTNVVSQKKTTFDQKTNVPRYQPDTPTPYNVRKEDNSKKTKRKCPRKLPGNGGMPEFEHFPVRDILKEGVSSGDDCEDAGTPFGGGFDDWGMEQQSVSDAEYDDYVQPTRKPLIFKELLNTKPLSNRNFESKRPTYNYENNEVRRKDSPSPTAPYDTIPDLPPPDAAFPNLFENLPSSPYGKPGGFFGSFNTKEKDFSATPNSYSSKSQPTKGKVERVTTYKPKPLYTTTPTAPPTYYERTTPSYYKKTSPAYQERTPPPVYNRGAVTPKLFDKRDKYRKQTKHDKHDKTKKLDIDISNSGEGGLSVTPGPYDFYTQRPRGRPSPTPYQFYSPTPGPTPAPADRPASLPPPDNFPAFPESGNHRKSGHRHHGPHPARPSPLQNLLSPFRNLFSLGGTRPRPPPPSNRRHYGHAYGDDTDRRPAQESVPAPLPPPVGFPDFHNNEQPQVQENFKYEYEQDERKRRRRKRPRRPLYDDTYRQEYQQEARVPGYRRDQLLDLEYSPSDTQETLTTALTTLPASTATTRQQELGVFNPGSIESESGFVPVMPANGNTPSLAFSIYDDGDYDAVGAGAGDTLMQRSDSSHGLLADSLDTDAGDRGHVAVNIPAPVLPYVPRAIQRSLDVETPQRNEVVGQDPWDAVIVKNTGHHVDTAQYPDVHPRSSQNSADFHSFETVAGADDGLNIRKVHDIRLSSQQLESDGPLLLSVGSSLSYGANRDPGTSVAVGSVGGPEYLHPQLLRDGTDIAYGNTRPGAGAGSDVVYGKVSESPTTPIKAIKEVDERLLEKLSLLEESSDKKKMEAYVSDLWAIMKHSNAAVG